MEILSLDFTLYILKVWSVHISDWDAFCTFHSIKYVRYNTYIGKLRQRFRVLGSESIHPSPVRALFNVISIRNWIQMVWAWFFIEHDDFSSLLFDYTFIIANMNVDISIRYLIKTISRRIRRIRKCYHIGKEIQPDWPLQLSDSTLSEPLFLWERTD